MKLCSLNRPVGPPSGARSVVGENQNERIIEYAHLLKEIEDATDLRVGVRQKPAKTSIIRAYTRRSSSESCSHARTQDGRSVKSRARGHDPRLALSRKGALAPRFPAVVETAPVGGDPLGRDMMRSMHRAGCEIEEKGLLRSSLLLVLNQSDGGVCEVLGQVIPLFGRSRVLHEAVVADELWCPLIGVSREEAVIPLKAEAERPALEGSRRVLFPPRSEMPLPDRECAVAPFSQDPR